MPTITTENCFTTIVEADAILDNFHSGGSWLPLSGDEKARLLITATTMLKMAYTSEVIDGAEAAVKGAAASFQALFTHQNADLIDNVMAASIGGVKSETLGSMSRSRNKGGFDMLDAISPYAKHLIAPPKAIEMMRG